MAIVHKENLGAQELVDLLESRERRRRWYASFYLAAILLASVVLTAWAGWQTAKVVEKRAELERLQGSLQEVQAQLEAKQTQLFATEAQVASLEQHTSERQQETAREVEENIREGVQRFRAKDYPGAIEAYDKALALDDRNYIAYEYKGYSLLQNKQPEEAVAILKHCVGIKNDYPWCHYNLALAYWAAGKCSEQPSLDALPENCRLAIQELATVVELNPDFRNTIKGDGQFRDFRRSPEFQRLVGEPSARRGPTR